MQYDCLKQVVYDSSTQLPDMSDGRVPPDYVLARLSTVFRGQRRSDKMGGLPLTI